jgi:hypothetical protein
MNRHKLRRAQCLTIFDPTHIRFDGLETQFHSITPLFVCSIARTSVTNRPIWRWSRRGRIPGGHKAPKHAATVTICWRRKASHFWRTLLLKNSLCEKRKQNAFAYESASCAAPGLGLVKRKSKSGFVPRGETAPHSPRFMRAAYGGLTRLPFGSATTPSSSSTPLALLLRCLGLDKPHVCPGDLFADGLVVSGIVACRAATAFAETTPACRSERRERRSDCRCHESCVRSLVGPVTAERF